MLPHRYRLRHTKDIQRVRRTGRRWFHPLALLLVAGNEREHSRFAVVAGRRVGRAVVRNRAKRLLREAIRAQLPEVAGGWDCLLIARPEMAGASYVEVEAAVRQLLARAEVFRPGPAGAE